MSSFCSVNVGSLGRSAARTTARAKRRRISIATAESCTAGQLAALFAAQPAAGDVYLGGFVVYSKAAKRTILGLTPGLLKRESAVSPRVAMALARSAKARAKATIAVAVTGVAGPTPDEDGNPVGLVFVATAGPGPRTKCRALRLGRKSPNMILLQAHRLALSMLAGAIDS